MRTNTLGVAGPAVSAIGLGTMTFGQETDVGEAHRILDAYVDAGGALVDTADVYAGGVSEEILGKWLADDPATPRPGAHRDEGPVRRARPTGSRA